MGMLEMGPRDEIRKLYDEPANRRLKRCAIGSLSVSISLMLAMIVWIDEIPARLMLFLRGCAGLGAILFVVLYACLVYRVYSRHIKGK